MKFYRVHYWSPVYGPAREHFSTKRDAVNFAKSVTSEMDIEVDLINVPATKKNILAMLDAVANMNGEGPTGYPGTDERILTLPATTFNQEKQDE